MITELIIILTISIVALVVLIAKLIWFFKLPVDGKSKKHEES